MTVYKITNIITGKIYVGITQRKLCQRWSHHKSRFKKNDRSDYALYRSMAKHGIDNFIIEAVDFANTREELEQKECEWITKLNTMTPNGYNMAEGGHLPSTSTESRAKQALKVSKPFKLCSPTGEIVEGVNLTKFCKEKGLVQANMQKVLSGKVSTCKGWTRHDFNPELYAMEHQKRLSKRFNVTCAFVGPNNKVYQSESIISFAKEHGLNPSTLTQVLKGKIKKHKGWRKAP